MYTYRDFVRYYAEINKILEIKFTLAELFLEKNHHHKLYTKKIIKIYSLIYEHNVCKLFR